MPGRILPPVGMRLELIAKADVVMNNLRGDLPAKMGLDYPALSSIKSSIVCVHISAYGRDNERTARPARTGRH